LKSICIYVLSDLGEMNVGDKEIIHKRVPDRWQWFPLCHVGRHRRRSRWCPSRFPLQVCEQPLCRINLKMLRNWTRVEISKTRGVPWLLLNETVGVSNRDSIGLGCGGKRKVFLLVDKERGWGCQMTKNSFQIGQNWQKCSRGN